MGLPSLWQDRALEPAHRRRRRLTGCAGPVAYDYDALIDVLVGLMEQYRPTVDPDPGPRPGHPAQQRGRPAGRTASSPATRTTPTTPPSPRSAWAALVRWVARATEDGGEVPGFVATVVPRLLQPPLAEEPPGRRSSSEKAAGLVPYGGDAGLAVRQPGRLRRLQRRRHPPADEQEGLGPLHPLPLPRRPPRRRRRAVRPAGRLWRARAAYGPLARDAARQRGLGTPRTTSAAARSRRYSARRRDGDGRQLLFGLRFAALGGHGGTNHREIVLLEQSSRGGAFRAWRGLGNPEPAPDRGRRIGVPVAVTAPDGRVHLFVRNADKGISTRVREHRRPVGRAGATWAAARSRTGCRAVVDGARAGPCLRRRSSRGAPLDAGDTMGLRLTAQRGDRPGAGARVTGPPLGSPRTVSVELLLPGLRRGPG